jgi:hypothetical protein
MNIFVPSVATGDGGYHFHLAHRVPRGPPGGAETVLRLARAAMEHALARLRFAKTSGTCLGATAVFQSPPHLHFSLEVPAHPGLHGDVTDTHYVDPAPFLVRSTIAATATHPGAPGAERERRHEIKPAF